MSKGQRTVIIEIIKMLKGIERLLKKLLEEGDKANGK